MFEVCPQTINVNIGNRNNQYRISVTVVIHVNLKVFVNIDENHFRHFSCKIEKNSDLKQTVKNDMILLAIVGSPILMFRPQSKGTPYRPVIYISQTAEHLLKLSFLYQLSKLCCFYTYHVTYVCTWLYISYIKQLRTLESDFINTLNNFQ